MPARVTASFRLRQRTKPIVTKTRIKAFLTTFATVGVLLCASHSILKEEINSIFQWLPDTSETPLDWFQLTEDSQPRRTSSASIPATNDTKSGVRIIGFSDHVYRDIAE